jgi:hypothetical protein
MARPRKPGLPGQLGLFDAVAVLDHARAFPSRLKAMLAEDLAHSPFRRDQVAARMSTLLGVTITVAQLDAYTAQTKQLHRLPLEYVPAFCESCRQFGALRLVAEECGCRLWRPADARQELDQVVEERRRLAERERSLRALTALDEV